MRTIYQQILGRLMWLVTATRPALALAVAQASFCSHRPTVEAAEKLNKVVRTPKTTSDTVATYQYIPKDMAIYVYTDAAFANNHDSSTQGDCSIFVGENVEPSAWKNKVATAVLVYWQSRKINWVESTLRYQPELYKRWKASTEVMA